MLLLSGYYVSSRNQICKKVMELSMMEVIVTTMTLIKRFVELSYVENFANLKGTCTIKIGTSTAQVVEVYSIFIVLLQKTTFANIF